MQKMGNSIIYYKFKWAMIFHSCDKLPQKVVGHTWEKRGTRRRSEMGIYPKRKPRLL